MKLKKSIALLSSVLLIATACGCAEAEDMSSDIGESSISVTENNTGGEKSADGVNISLKLNSSWESGGETTYDYTVTIENNSDAPCSSWNASIPVAEGSKVISAWSMTYTLENNVISVTPESYNSTVEVGGSVEFGFQMTSSAEIDASVITLSTEKGSVQTNNSSSGNNNTQNNNNNNNSGTDKIVSANAKEVPEPSTDDWLSAKGSKLVDSSGKEVWLTGCNWFGYNTGTNCFDGLWACDLDASIASIADHGFNLLRIPISTELVNNWEDGEYPAANYNNATNAYLNGLNSLEIFDHVIGQCRANGIKIMIDFHCAVTDAMGHNKPLWTDGDVTEDDYYRGLEWIASRYKNDDTIIALDLENEPHGKHNESPRAKWDGSKDSDNWKYIAEQAAGKVLAKNPNLLVMVEGIEIYPKDIKSNGNFKSQNEDDYLFNWWGGNLRGVADNPVDLGKNQNKLVYSPHDYGPTVYEQPWFKGSYDFDSLMKDCWHDNWFYIQEENIAPLLIGEWGGYMTEPNVTWMTYLRQLISKNKINHTFWCFNANSGDTGGLVLDDFTTWDTDKYEFVKEVLWQKDGKFVSLDHEIPLGSNGISLSDY